MAPLKVSGDPKRPSDGKAKNLHKVPAEEGTPQNLWFTMSMLVAMGSLLFKIRVGGWLALLCSLMGFANSKTSELEWKTIISTVFMAIMGIAFLHFQNWVQPRQPFANVPLETVAAASSSYSDAGAS